jgi:radical SAM superfamily enzyme YgiQ (UPF0313 family)
MELPRRSGVDRFLSHSPLAACDELAGAIRTDNYRAVVVYPFDPFTEIGPFLGYSKHVITAGPWVVGSLLRRAGLTVRIVQQVWNPGFKPSQAILDGKPIDLLAISCMNIHVGKAQELIRDASRMGADRPLVICGGPKYIYQPTDAWRGTSDCWPDLVVTGEAHVLISVLHKICGGRRGDETLAKACRRLRDDGELEGIPGLVYKTPGRRLQLVDTGVAQLSKTLERPFAVEGLALYERPSRRHGLSSAPMPLDEVGRRISVLITPGVTEGCTETCGFCPIPGRMQRSYRTSDHEFIKEDFIRVVESTGIRDFGLGDDSHFNSNYCEGFWAGMAAARHNGKPLQGQIFLGTEAVLAHVKKRMHVLSNAALGGLTTLWFGIETFNTQDLDKGQDPQKTADVFAELRRNGISPMAMTILFQGQGWRGTSGHPFGAADTVELLDRYGAAYMQMAHITASPGSRFYEGHFERGEVLSRAGSYVVEDRCFDGNRVTIDFSRGANPRDCARRQMIIIGAYWTFYNPGRLIRLLLKYLAERTPLRYQDVRLCSIGLGQTIISTIRYAPWIVALWRGPWARYSTTPELKVPVTRRHSIKLFVPLEKDQAVQGRG